MEFGPWILLDVTRELDCLGLLRNAALFLSFSNIDIALSFSLAEHNFFLSFFPNISPTTMDLHFLHPHFSPMPTFYLALLKEFRVLYFSGSAAAIVNSTKNIPNINFLRFHKGFHPFIYVRYVHMYVLNEALLLCVCMIEGAG